MEIFKMILDSAPVVLTIGLTCYAYAQTKIAKQSLLYKQTPCIMIFLKSSEDKKIMNLHVKNIGEGAAKNLKFNILEDFGRLSTKIGEKVSDIGMIKNGMNIFIPSYELKYVFFRTISQHEKKNILDSNGKVVIEVSYESLDGREFNETFDLPFNQHSGVLHSRSPNYYLEEISNYLKEISEKKK